MKDTLSLLAAIGLSPGEQKVYLALLELGESTSGPIAHESKVSASKIYQVVERLMQKGLVGEVEKKGTKHFTAIHPRALLNYLEQRQAHFKELQEAAEAQLPQLIATFEATAQPTEVQLFEGVKSFRNEFYKIANSLKAGERYEVLGANYGTQKAPWAKPFYSSYHQYRAEQGVGVRLLFQQENLPTKEMKQGDFEYKVLPPDYKNPLQVVTYQDTTLLHILDGGPLLIKIKNAEITESFRQYFEGLWNQDIQTFRGDTAVPLLIEDILASKEELYLIGAHGQLPERYPDTYERWVNGMKTNGTYRYHLSEERTRGKEFNKRGLVKTWYLPKEYLSPMVIWIYGDTVVHALWEEEVTLFKMKNKQVAEDYKQYFQMLKKLTKNQSSQPK